MKIQGINLRNSACWTSTYDRCDKLIIEGVTVDSRAFWNNDGIDIVDCTNTVVQKCFVSASDDGICLKSHSNKVRCENVTVRDNVITSSASGIKFGTFSKGGFKDIKLFNNTVYDTFRSAIAIEAVDGGMAEDIVVDGLKSLNTANPIFLIVGARHGEGSYMKNVIIKNVYAEVPATKPDRGYDYEGPTLEDEPRNTSPCSIVGLPGNNVQNVTLENVEIKFPGGGDVNYAHVTWDEIAEMAQSGLVEIGNHTYDLHTLTDRKGCRIKPGESEAAYRAMLTADVQTLQDRLTAVTGQAPAVFTFPYGNVCSQGCEVVEAMGFRVTLGCEEKVNIVTQGDPDCLKKLRRFNRAHGISSQSFLSAILDE